MGLGEASSWFDSHVIDGAVNGAGWMTRLSGTISSWWDKWIIDGVRVNGPAILARMLSYPAASVAVGPGAVVCAGDGDRAWWDSFSITCSASEPERRAVS